MSTLKHLGRIGVVFAFAFLLSGCEEASFFGMGDDEGPVISLNDKSGASAIVDNGFKGDTIRVGVISWRDLPFQTVKHQAYDYSCGSAAVATLVTYVYGMPATEKEVFREMFVRGDRDKIRREGFSMLDMSKYLSAHGLESKGVRISQKAIMKYRLPFIALVNNKGYNHFVVVKTMGGGRILVGDPNTGNTEYAPDEFAKIWNGLALVVVNNAGRAHAAFDNQKEWRYARMRAHLRGGNDVAEQARELSPTQWQIAIPPGDILPTTMMGLVATTTAGGGS